MKCFVCGAGTHKGEIALPRWGMAFCSWGCRGRTVLWLQLCAEGSEHATLVAQRWHGHEGKGVDVEKDSKPRDER